MNPGKCMNNRLPDGLRLESAALRTSSVAHDFNNLITIIESYVGELELAAGHPECLEMLAGIREATGRARTLSSSLLASGRRDTVGPQQGHCDLHQCIRRTMLLAQRLMRPDVRVELSLTQDTVVVPTSPSQFDQVLLNLIINAQDAMPNGGTLSIETQCAPQDLPRHGPAWVELRVGDTGTGMSDETQQYLFEPFFTTKDTGKGSGLGLSIVHDRVVEAGGRIVVESELGVGSCFRVWFPVVDPAMLSVEANNGPVAGSPTMVPGQQSC